MKIIISPRAEKELKKFVKIDQIAITRKIRRLAETQVTQVEKLKGLFNIYRVRVGNYRIVYKKTTDKIYIILIGHRKDIYQILKRLL